MTQHLTPDLIAEALDVEQVDLTVYPAVGRRCVISFDHKGGGLLGVALYDVYDNGDELECRTFRLVEVES